MCSCRPSEKKQHNRIRQFGAKKTHMIIDWSELPNLSAKDLSTSLSWRITAIPLARENAVPAGKQVEIDLSNFDL